MRSCPGVYVSVPSAASVIAKKDLRISLSSMPFGYSAEWFDIKAAGSDEHGRVYHVKGQRTNESVRSVCHSYTGKWCVEKVRIRVQRVFEGILSMLYAIWCIRVSTLIGHRIGRTIDSQRFQVVIRDCRGTLQLIQRFELWKFQTLQELHKQKGPDQVDTFLYLLRRLRCKDNNLPSI